MYSNEGRTNQFSKVKTRLFSMALSKTLLAPEITSSRRSVIGTRAQFKILRFSGHFRESKLKLSSINMKKKYIINIIFFRDRFI